MMRVIFTVIARQELEDAARYYELEYSGFGRRFMDEVRQAVLRQRTDLSREPINTMPYKFIAVGLFALYTWFREKSQQELLLRIVCG